MALHAQINWEIRNPSDTSEPVRSATISNQRKQAWPVNEIMLFSLLNSDRSGVEIADLCGVGQTQIAQLRDFYEM